MTKQDAKWMAIGSGIGVVVLSILAAVPSQTDFDSTYFKTNALPISLVGNLTNWSKLNTNAAGGSFWTSNATTLLSVFPPADSSVPIVQISTNATGPWGNSANIYLGTDNDSIGDMITSGSIVGIGDWSISGNSVLSNVVRFMSLGDSTCFGSTILDSARLLAIGPGAFSASYITNSFSMIGIGDDCFYTSLATNCNYLFGFGSDSMSFASFANSDNIVGLNQGSLYGVQLTNSHNVNSLGIFNAWPTYPSGSAFSGTWTNVTMLGGYARATNNNDFIVGNQWHNYFFPGNSARFNGIATTSLTMEPSVVAYSASLAVNFGGSGSLWTVLGGDLTLSSSSLAAGRKVTYRIDNATATNCNVILPTTWRKISGTVTNILAPNAIGLLSVTSYAANDTNVVCLWSSE